MQECVLVAYLSKLRANTKITAKLFSRDEKQLADNSTLLVTHWVALLILYRKKVTFSPIQKVALLYFYFQNHHKQKRSSPNFKILNSCLATERGTKILRF